ncbi:MAG: hypothetical protein IKW60_02955 [Clostridia bacterium]|nr:hypothetical protein [Clostridia bacterium]
MKTTWDKVEKTPLGADAFIRTRIKHSVDNRVLSCYTMDGAKNVNVREYKFGGKKYGNFYYSFGCTCNYHYTEY